MKANKVLKILQINRVTLYRYLRDGKIQGERLASGHYNYDEDSVYKLAGLGKRVPAIYLRGDDESLLNATKRSVFDRLQISESDASIYVDSVEPSNLNRAVLNNLIDDIINHKISELIITVCPDYVIPFGEKLLETICKCSDCKLIKLNLD